jgi:hypothetical protein
MPAGAAPTRTDFERADLWPSLSQAVRHAQALAGPDRRPWLQTSSGIIEPDAVLDYAPVAIGPDGQFTF